MRVEPVSTQLAPYHPGRCAALRVGERVVGHAGELHPRVIAALGLPPRTAALELDLSALLELEASNVRAPELSSFPEATRDVAVVVPGAIPVAEVAEALSEGAGSVLESLALFDVYVGEPVPAGHRSLAFAMHFRAPDRTLTDDEVNAARDSALALASQRTGATLRG